MTNSTYSRVKETVTGKTEVLAAVIEGCYRQGQRVLFVAPTHVAVDQALLRVCERLQAEPDFERGLVQRLKGAQLHELSERFGTFIDPDAVESRLLTQLTATAEALRRERSRLSATLARLRELDVAERMLADLATCRSGAEAAVSDAARQCGRGDRLVRDLDLKIAASNAATGVTGAWRRRSLPDLTAQRATAQARRSQGDAELAARRQQLDQLKDQTEQAGARRDRLLGELGSPRPGQTGVQQALARVDEDLKRLETERSNLRTAVRQATRVSATTIAAAATGQPPANGYDTVVVNEAGMVDLASAFAVTAQARHRVVIAGDFRQLPAVIRADPSRLPDPDRDVFLTDYARDVFAASGMTTNGGALTGDSRLVALGEQYRMRPGICDLVNVIAYPDAPLRTGRSDISRVTSSPLLQAPLILIDTSGRVITRRGNANPVHAAVIRQLIRGLQYDAVLPAR
jgi:hypothetical protein